MARNSNRKSTSVTSSKKDASLEVNGTASQATKRRTSRTSLPPDLPSASLFGSSAAGSANTKPIARGRGEQRAPRQRRQSAPPATSRRIAFDNADGSGSEDAEVEEPQTRRANIRGNANSNGMSRRRGRVPVIEEDDDGFDDEEDEFGEDESEEEVDGSDEEPRQEQLTAKKRQAEALWEEEGATVKKFRAAYEQMLGASGAIIDDIEKHQQAIAKRRKEGEKDIHHLYQAQRKAIAQGFKLIQKQSAAAQTQLQTMVKDARALPICSVGTSSSTTTAAAKCQGFANGRGVARLTRRERGDAEVVIKMRQDMVDEISKAMTEIMRRRLLATKIPDIQVAQVGVKKAKASIDFDAKSIRIERLEVQESTFKLQPGYVLARFKGIETTISLDLFADRVPRGKHIVNAVVDARAVITVANNGFGELTVNVKKADVTFTKFEVRVPAQPLVDLLFEAIELLIRERLDFSIANQLKTTVPTLLNNILRKQIRAVGVRPSFKYDVAVNFDGDPRIFPNELLVGAILDGKVAYVEPTVEKLRNDLKSHAIGT
ncbi:hypothetical protein HK102_010677 [Quaeritorhiza haematococci]|nr:hypothetical protein HK102_010677 [Quaeritorhiza haematococci]